MAHAADHADLVGPSPIQAPIAFHPPHELTSAEVEQTIDDFANAAALAQADLASGRLVAPFPDGSEAVGFAYYVVQPRDRPPSPSATAFVGWLKKQAVDHDNTMGQL